MLNIRNLIRWILDVCSKYPSTYISILNPYTEETVKSFVGRSRLHNIVYLVQCDLVDRLKIHGTYLKFKKVSFGVYSEELDIILNSLVATKEIYIAKQEPNVVYIVRKHLLGDTGLADHTLDSSTEYMRKLAKLTLHEILPLVYNHKHYKIK
jgi:hypothetical protein